MVATQGRPQTPRCDTTPNLPQQCRRSHECRTNAAPILTTILTFRSLRAPFGPVLVRWIRTELVEEERTCRFEQYEVELILPIAQLFESLDQIATHSAARAAVIHADDLLGSLRQQRKRGLREKPMAGAAPGGGCRVGSQVSKPSQMKGGAISDTRRSAARHHRPPRRRPGDAATLVIVTVTN